MVCVGVKGEGRWERRWGEGVWGLVGLGMGRGRWCGCGGGGWAGVWWVFWVVFFVYYFCFLFFVYLFFFLFFFDRPTDKVVMTIFLRFLLLENKELERLQVCGGFDVLMFGVVSCVGLCFL